MWLLNAMIIAIAMYSKIPMPRVDWNGKKYEICDVLFPVGRSYNRSMGNSCRESDHCMEGRRNFLLCSCTDSDSGFHNRGNSSGWIRRYHGRKKFLWRSREEAADTEGSSYGSICDHQSLLLFPFVCGDFLVK